MKSLRRILSILALALLVVTFALRRSAPEQPGLSRTGSAARRGPTARASFSEKASGSESQAMTTRREAPAVAAPLIAAPSGGPARFMLRDGSVSAFLGDKGMALALVPHGGAQGFGIHWGVVGGRPVEPQPEGRCETRVSRFRGPADTWRSDEPAVAGVRYPDVLPGIDLFLEPRPHGIHYGFTLAPGADPAGMTLCYEGAPSLQVSERGDSVRIGAGPGSLTETGLKAWQEIDGRRVSVEAHYVAVGGDQVRIQPGPYDRSRPLQVDPVIGWSSFLGGSRGPGSFGGELAQAVAVDSGGNVYVAGTTRATDFPLVGAFDTSAQGDEVFVCKINSTGTSLVWSTYLGGDGTDNAHGIALDGAGNVYVLGLTNSGDFPAGAVFSPSGIPGNLFVAKIAASGSSLVWTTRMGGWGAGIAVDSAGDVVITGWTSPAEFAIHAALMPIAASAQPAFVAKIDSTGTRLLWSTFLGGSGGGEFGNAVAVDSSRNVYVVGYTYAADFPIVGGFKTTLTGQGPDGYVVKIEPGGSRILWSSYLGGSAGDIPRGVAVDAQSNVYIAGYTNSTDFPVVGSGSKPFGGGNSDAFVLRVNAAGSNVVWSTCLGGTSDDLAYGIALDGSANVYVTGETYSADFPLVAGLGRPFGGSKDSFIAKFTKAGARSWVSLLGGISDDTGLAVAATSDGHAVVAGVTYSGDFPLAGAIDSTMSGGGDAFISKLNPSGTALDWSTYLGGQAGPANDYANAVCLDPDGNIYVTGETLALDFPLTPGAFDASTVGSDAFVTKIAASGAQVLWSSYLGGSLQDVGRGIAIDSARNVYVTGDTQSADFPLVGAINSTLGYLDAFVAKIDASGTSLLWSTYLGGGNYDFARGIAVDSRGDCYVTGTTLSSDFPVTATAYQKTLGGTGDAYVTKINSAGTQILWSTFLGGTGGEEGHAIAVDTLFQVYVAGFTTSTNFPVKSGFAMTYRGGPTDGFVTKLAADGKSLVWSSFLGGTDDDRINALRIDSARNVYIAGETRSTDFPATTSFSPGGRPNAPDAFVVKVKAGGGAIAWSMILGGGSSDSAQGLDLDSAGNVYITGVTYSANFPFAGATRPLEGYGDVYVAKINAAGNRILWATPIGGYGSDQATGIAVDAQGRAVVVGYTSSSDFPAGGGFDSTIGAEYDGFVTRIDRTSPPQIQITTPTTQASWTAFATPFTIGGVVSDDDGISGVSWRNATNNKTGLATGTTLWSASIPLVAGANALTVTATDSTGNTATASLTVTLANPTNLTLIPKQSVWGYVDSGIEPYGNWTFTDDGTWATGPGPLGYGESYLNTILSYGPDPAHKPITAYFRKSFYLGRQHPIQKLTVNVMYDDGFVLWLNGNVIAWANVPTPPITSTTPAKTAREAGNKYVTFDLDPQVLFNGFNVIAFEVHQRTASDPDLVFDAELLATVDLVADTTPPVVTVSGQNPPQIIGGTIPIVFPVYVQATDDLLLSSVELRVDGISIGIHTAPKDFALPFQWNTAGFANGPHSLVGVAVDGAGNVGTSPPVTILLSNSILNVTTLVAAKSVWKYDDTGVGYPYDDWSFQGFDDSTWKSGAGPLGYGETYIATPVSYGSDPANKHITTYFRKTFTVADASNAVSVRLKVMYDDGFLVRINGNLVAYRNYNPSDPNRPANGPHEANNAYEIIDLQPYEAWLVTGTNTIAVEVHQENATSDDLVFDLALELNKWTTDTVPPTVSIASPAANATVSGLVDLAAAASDDHGLYRVELYVDGKHLQTLWAVPYMVIWDTSRFTNGAHTLSAKAFDLWNNSSTSASVQVTVQNP
jgi:hypothetical protein